MLRTLACSLALLTAGMAAGRVHAGEAQQDARACAGETDPARRLECYDHAVGRDSALAPVPEPLPVRRAMTADVFSNSQGGFDSRCDKELPSSLLDSRWELDPGRVSGTKPPAYCIRAYRPVYLMPFYFTSKTNPTPSSPSPGNTVTDPEKINRGEVKYQLSLKTKIWRNVFGDNGDLWMGYTQVSHWQIYNAERSRPFRETNYEPDANLVFRTTHEGTLLGWTPRMFGFGLVHQSNGRSDPLSRSWNRATAMLGLERDNWTVIVRPWWRVLEFGDDNNPDISDYMGRGNIEIVHVDDKGEHQFALMLRHSLRGGDRSHGALQFDYAFPIAPPLRGHVQVFNGYGESLIDYNHRAWYAGVGVSLIEWY